MPTDHPSPNPNPNPNPNQVQRRRQFWRADWEKGLTHWSKTLSAALFLMFATLFSTVALGALVEKATHK